MQPRTKRHRFALAGAVALLAPPRRVGLGTVAQWHNVPLAPPPLDASIHWCYSSILTQAISRLASLAVLQEGALRGETFSHSVGATRRKRPANARVECT